MKTITALLALAALALPQVLLAEDSLAEEQGQPPIRASEYQRSDEGPEIVIRGDEGQTYYEYRVNGELQEIRIEPEVGPVYYLIPVEGGYIRRENSTLLLPSWVLFRW